MPFVSTWTAMLMKKSSSNFGSGNRGTGAEQEHRHSQSFRVMRAVGGDMSGDAGELMRGQLTRSCMPSA